jgi:hypothetical protein
MGVGLEVEQFGPRLVPGVLDELGIGGAHGGDVRDIGALFTVDGGF